MRKILFTATILRDHVGIVAHYHTPTRHGSVRADTIPEALERLKQLAAELDAEAIPKEPPATPALRDHHLELGFSYLEGKPYGEGFRFYDGSIDRHYNVTDSDVRRLGRMLETAKTIGDPEAEAYLAWRAFLDPRTLTIAP
ncbi:MAG: hypothetical protein A2Y78_08415 [Acidobacteria bacterium RBG_13_68_16]|nr:MAG: hypothetical protein A2Y78_08415 [Acidobacteria bacterium RBG_13_68_16]